MVTQTQEQMKWGAVGNSKLMKGVRNLSGQGHHRSTMVNKDVNVQTLGTFYRKKYFRARSSCPAY